MSMHRIKNFEAGFSGGAIMICFIVLLTLRVTGLLLVPWWLVFMPIWFPIIGLVVLMTILFLVYLAVNAGS